MKVLRLTLGLNYRAHSTVKISRLKLQLQLAIPKSMTVKWTTAQDDTATVKAVTCTFMCTTPQTQVLPLNLAHFLIYVTAISDT